LDHHHPFENKIVLVTGSSRGIGRGIALHFVNLVAQVVINFFQNRILAEETAAEIRELGKDALIVKAALETDAGLDYLFKEVVNGFRGLAILVNGGHTLRDKSPVQLLPLLCRKHGNLHFSIKQFYTISNFPGSKKHPGGILSE